MGYSKHCDFLDFIGVDVAQDSTDELMSSPYFTSPRASMTTGIVSVFISYILLISILRPLYLVTFSVNFFFFGGVQYLFQMELLCQ